MISIEITIRIPTNTIHRNENDENKTSIILIRKTLASDEYEIMISISNHT